jgi:hypothetical protein
MTEHCWRHGETKSFSGFEVDDHLHTRGKFDWQFAWFSTLQNFVDIRGGATKALPNVYTVADYGTGLRKFALAGHPGQPGGGSQSRNPASLAVQTRCPDC